MRRMGPIHIRPIRRIRPIRPIPPADNRHRFIDFHRCPALAYRSLMQTQLATRLKQAPFLSILSIAFFGFLLLAFVQKWSASQSQAPGCISSVGMVDSIG
jgi:hypothetical protein